MALEARCSATGAPVVSEARDASAEAPFDTLSGILRAQGLPAPTRTAMTPVTATTPPLLELTLTVDHTEVSRARGAIVRALTDLGRHDLVDDAALIVSELATNAIRETEEQLRSLARSYLVSGRVEVKFLAVDGWLIVEVWDEFPHKVPKVQAPRPHQEGGRGLFVVSELSEKWGCAIEGAWKCVWAVLASPSC